PRWIRWFRRRRLRLRGYVELAPTQTTTLPNCRPYQTELRTFVAAEPWPLGIASSEVHGPFLTSCVEPHRQSRNPSFIVRMARVEALRSSGFCCPRLLRYYDLFRLPARRRGPLRLAPYRAAYGGGVSADRAGSRPFPHTSFRSCRCSKHRG